MATKHSFYDDARTPSSLQKIVTLRIERLGDDSRGVLQSAAVIGTSFEYKLLKELIGPLTSHLLDVSLKELERFDFVFEKSKFPKRIFQFRNDQIKEIIYNSIPPHKKLKLHGDIAAYFERLSQINPDENMAVIARHYLNSDKIDKAIEYSYKTGEIMLVNYKLHEALDFFIKAYELIPATDSAEHMALKKNIFKHKWQIYLLLGNYDLSLASLNFIKTMLDGQDYVGALELKQMIAETLVERGDFYRAEEMSKEILGLAKAKHDDKIVIKVLKLLGFINVFRENTAGTRSICEEGLFLCGSHDEKERGQFLLFLGLAEYYENDYTRALAYFNKSLDIFKKTGDKALIGKAYCNIGMIYFRRDKFEEAMSYYNRSLEILQGIEYLRAAAITRMNLAVLYDHLGDYDRALSEYNSVLRESEETGNARVLMMVLCNLGEVYNRLGHYKLGLKYLRDSISVANQIGSLFWKASALLHLGISNSENGNTSIAKNLFKEAVELNKVIGEKGKQFEVRLELQKIDINEKNAIESLKSIYGELEKRKNLGQSENLKLRCILIMAAAEAQNGDSAKTRYLLEEGLRISIRKNYNELIFIYRTNLAKYFDSIWNQKLAREYLKKADQAFSTVIQKIPRDMHEFYKNKPLTKEFLALLIKHNIKSKLEDEVNKHELFENSI